MNVLIDSITDKLQHLSASRLKEILAFTNFLDWQDSQAETSTNTASADNSTISVDDAGGKQADWQAIVRECAGAWPDFPSAEEIRSTVGEDIPREKF